MGKKNKKRNEPGPSGGGGGDASAEEKPKPQQQQQPPKQDKPKPENEGPSNQQGKGKKRGKGGQQQEGDTQHAGGAQQAQQHHEGSAQQIHQRQQKAYQPQQKADQPQQPQQQQKGQKQKGQEQKQQVISQQGEPPQQRGWSQMQQQQLQAQQFGQTKPPDVWGHEGGRQQAWGSQQHPQGVQQGAPQQQGGPPQGVQQGGPPQQRGGPPQQRGWPQMQQQQLQAQQFGQTKPPNVWGHEGGRQQAWGSQQHPQGVQQGAPQQQGGPPQGVQQGAPQQQGGPPQQRGGPPQQRGGPPQQRGGPPQQRGGPPQQRGGPPQQQGGPPQQRGGPPQQQGGPPQQRGGPPQQQGMPKPSTGQKEPQESPYSSPLPSTRESTPKMKQSPSIQSMMSDISIKSDSSVSSYHGKLGKPMKMEANYVDLKLSDKIKEVYHYDVAIDPDKPKRLLRLAFRVFAETKFPKIPLAYDGKANCYSPQMLKTNINTPVEVTVEDVEFQQKKTYKITLKETETFKVDMTSLKNYRDNRVFDKPMRAIQCLDVVLQQPCVERAKQAGRSYYKRPDEFIDLKDGYQLYLGLFQSMVLGDTPLLNIDVSHKAFPIGGNLINYMIGMNFDIQRELDPRFDVRRLSEYLKGLRLTYVPPSSDISTGKDYTFNEVKQSANRERFEYNGQNITIAQYYQQHKQFKLKYPHLPVLWVGGKTKNVMLPIELCYLRDGQVTNKKAGTQQVREMIRYAATSTIDRKKRIMDLYRYFSHMTHPCVTAFGLTLGSEFITVDARVIDAPQILYSDNKSVRVNKGSWNNQNMKFLQPVQNIKWAILYTDNRDKFNLNRLVDQVKSIARSLNMVLDNNHLEECCPDYRKQKEFLQNCKKQNVSLVFVILNRDKQCYSNIKLLAETDIGILTQCIKGETLAKRMNQSTISNILLKVNTKLNGQNHKIEPRSEVRMLLDRSNAIMFVGADVTHPSPDQTRIPSVVGVVSSYNETFSQYFKSFRLQDPKQEMIQDMANIMHEHFIFFQKKRGKLPTKIIYYRDGVSDGQFEDLRKKELNAMNQACTKMDQKYKPQITCIVVQKRHHTRFFPNANDPNVRNDRYKNAPPGTIVDQKITHPKEFQFFLVSHESIQGTAKPTKYCVIRDDSNIDVDEMQAMTYNLCHMFARCNRAVSYPAPAYYAHLAAARGRVYIEYSRSLDIRNLNREYDRLMMRREFFQQYPTFFI